MKGKDLTYDASQPAFLQRLRGQLASGDTARHEQPMPRPRRMQKDDDDDDAPAYVMEETGESLSKDAYDALVAGEKEQAGDCRTDSREKKTDDVHKEGLKKPDSEEAEKGNVKGIGQPSRKRKVVKVVGDEQDEEPHEAPKKAVKTKKKAKTVKLSFDD